MAALLLLCASSFSLLSGAMPRTPFTERLRFVNRWSRFRKPYGLHFVKLRFANRKRGRSVCRNGCPSVCRNGLASKHAAAHDVQRWGRGKACAGIAAAARDTKQEKRASIFAFQKPPRSSRPFLSYISTVVRLSHSSSVSPGLRRPIAE
jgi:hypothetical protein